MKKKSLTFTLILVIAFTVFLVSGEALAADNQTAATAQAKGVVDSVGGIIGVGLTIEMTVEGKKETFILNDTISKKHGLIKDAGGGYMGITDRLRGKKVELIYDKKNTYNNKYYKVIELKELK